LTYVSLLSLFSHNSGLSKVGLQVGHAAAIHLTTRYQFLAW
jgi:hypothetical protein